MRKAHEPVVPKANTHTPQEFSRAKWEKEEKHRQMREQYEAQMKVGLPM
jgi:chromatin modification-related protein VID21